MADETFQVLVEIREKLQGLEKTEQKFRQANRAAKGFGDTAKTAFGTFFGMTGAQAASRAVDILKRSVTQLHSELIQTDIESRKIMNSFKFVTGSVAGARKEFDRSYKLADKYGQSVQVVSKSYGQLAAASKGTNLEGEETIRILEGMLAASTVLGRDGYELEGMLRAVDQMISKGNVQAEELRGQLGERLPGAFQLAARSMGVTTEQLNDMLDRGEVLAEDLLPKLATELLDTFGPEVAAATDTIQAKQNRLANTWFKLKKELADQGYADNFADALERITKAIQEPEFKEAISEITEDMGDLVTEVSQLVEYLDEAVKFLGDLKDLGILAIRPADLGPAARIYSRHFGGDDSKDRIKLPDIVGNGGGRPPPDDTKKVQTVSRLAMATQELAQIQADLIRLESDRLTPTLLKRKEELQLLEDKAAWLGELARLFKEEGDRLMEEGNTSEAYEFYDRRDEAQTGQIVALNDLMAEGTFGGQFTAGIAEWMEDFQTFGEAASSLFTDTLDPLVKDFGSTFIGTLRSGGDEMDAVKATGMKMFDNFLMGVINYGIQWGATQLLIKDGMISTEALAVALRAKRMAATAAEGIFNLAALIPGAIAASITSFGGAAILGTALVMGAIAAFGGFADGGYTGNGGVNDIAGFVHGREFTLKAPSTASIGLPTLEYMNRTGRIPPQAAAEALGTSGGGGESVSGSSAPGSGSGVPHRTIVVDNRRLGKQLAADPDFESAVMDIVQANKGDLFS